jgi:uncharacterized membrane protein
MKSLTAGFLAITLMTVAGCGDKGTPGGPGVNDPNAKKPIVGTAEDTFTLDVPNLATTLKQGETKTITIAIKRGKNFDESVALNFTGLPSGVSATPAGASISKADKEVKITLTAAADAAIGEFVVKVHGDPTKGADAHNEFKLNVEKP